MPEDDEVFDEVDEDFGKKFSIRALNFNMMSKIMNQNTMLQRASSRLLTSNRNRGTQGSKFNGSILGKGGNGKVSRISKMVLSTNRESDINYYIDEGSLDEESTNSASHRCSMVKRYNMPTFFTPDKSKHALSAYQTAASNSPQVTMQDLNVQQPNNLPRPSANDTIIEEETGEDESILRQSRFSQKLKDDENIDLLPPSNKSSL